MKKIIYVLTLLLLGIGSIFAQETASKYYSGMAWSPDGKYLSFTIMNVQSMKPMKMTADIYVMKTDGTDLKKITGDSGNNFSPSWSKDGKRIIFYSVKPETKEAQIYSIKRDGSDLVQLTKTGRNAEPVVSPDGKKIVFHSERIERKPQICVMNIDGSDIKALTNDETLAFYSPVWSPDGKKIVYYIEKGDNKDQIWTMNADGSDQKLLTNNVGHNFFPSWTADGKGIIFTSNRDGEEQVIYWMKPDGSNVKRLLQTNSFYAKPSPDGKKIAFISGKFPKNAIYIANADGSGEKKITED